MARARVACKEPARQTVRARDAASLILLRSGPEEPEVLMGRRAPGSRFMPDLYVFPGGAVERSDSLARPASPLNPLITHHLAVRGRAARARSLAMAAVRETFEETGLLLADPGDVGSVRSSAWSAMRALGLAPALERLAYVGRAITPVPFSIRFHARFFVADAHFLQGTLAGDAEMEDLHWRPVSAVAELPMADVQFFMLTRAVSVVTRKEHDQEATPLFTRRAGRRHIRYIKPDR